MAEAEDDAAHDDRAVPDRLPPLLERRDSFQSTSGCALRVPMGSMQGGYQMVTPPGEQFDAQIAPFTLKAPYTVH